MPAGSCRSVDARPSRTILAREGELGAVGWVGRFGAGQRGSPASLCDRREIAPAGRRGTLAA